MLRFDKPKRRSVRNYFSRREQWRLLLLVLSLGVVIVVFRAVRRPENVERVASAFAGHPEAEVIEKPVSTPDRGPSAQAVAPKMGYTQRAADSPNLKQPSASMRLPVVPREALQAVEDNTFFRNAEKDAWFRCLEVLQHASPEQIAATNGTEADYVQLVDQPDFYRGKFVTVRGWVRQVTKQKPAANELGIDVYYRVVIQPTDGASWPILVYCLELPPGLQEGADTAGSVKVTGLFFKNLSYQWRDGLGIAPVILAKSIEYFGAAAAEPAGDTYRPVEVDAWTDAKPQAAVAGTSSAQSTPFRDVLALAGWDVPQLAAFDDGQPFSPDQRLLALQLLRRLRSFDSASLDAWAHEDLAPDSMLTRPDEHRGRLVRLAGRVTKVTKRAPDAADAARLELPEYFECELVLDNQAGAATVLTTRVPEAWLTAPPLDEPATAVALYLKRLSNDDPPPAVWLAKELAWHPTTVDDPRVSFGKSVLGSLGMDVGLLDGVRDRGSIRAAEREAFYQVLDAVGRIGAYQLARFAQENLDRYRESWAREIETASDPTRRALALEVVRRAKEGRYSVAPLFNDPEPNTGQLFTFDGVARRVARVEVGSRADGRPSDVVRRFGMDHYYEIEVFTDDSQNYPLVFCVRELPQGFLIGGSLHVPVRAAGFFFKDWLYTARGTSGSEAGDLDAAAPRRQYAPLLIGRSPLALQIDDSDGGNFARLLGGTLFLLGLAGFGAAAWWFARDDRKFVERTRNTAFSLPVGESLNELNLSATVEPMNYRGQSESDTGDAF